MEKKYLNLYYFLFLSAVLVFCGCSGEKITLPLNEELQNAAIIEVLNGNPMSHEVSLDDILANRKLYFPDSYFF